MGGSFGVESVAALPWNMQSDTLKIQAMLQVQRSGHRDNDNKGRAMRTELGKPALKEFQVPGFRTIDGRQRYTLVKSGKASTVMYRKGKQIQICYLIVTLNAVQVYH